MVTAQEAFKLIESSLSELKFNTPDKVPLEEAVCRVLSQDVLADRDQPSFDRVAMDGFALSGSSLSLDSWEIEELQRAGAPQEELKNRQNCYEVMTGAPLPKNCTTVIPYENTKIEKKRVSLNIESFEDKKNIHFKGSDYSKDQTLIKKGKTITSADIAVLASAGLTHVLVQKKLSVAFVSTGDELVAISDTPAPHQIRQSNSHAMRAELMAYFPFMNAEIIHLKDEEKEMTTNLERISQSYDLVILSGGVSMGKFDFVPKVLKEVGIQEIFHKISQRPGRPLWFGEKKGEAVFIGMPGNPVSCLMSLRKYVIEALKPKKTTLSGTLNEDVTFKKELTYFLPVKVSFDEALSCQRVTLNGSGDYYSLSKSDGFLELPKEKSLFKSGEVYPLYLWGGSRC